MQFHEAGEVGSRKQSLHGRESVSGMTDAMTTGPIISAAISMSQIFAIDVDRRPRQSLQSGCPLSLNDEFIYNALADEEGIYWREDAWIWLEYERST